MGSCYHSHLLNLSQAVLFPYPKPTITLSPHLRQAEVKSLQRCTVPSRPAWPHPSFGFPAACPILSLATVLQPRWPPQAPQAALILGSLHCAWKAVFWKFLMFTLPYF